MTKACVLGIVFTVLAWRAFFTDPSAEGAAMVKLGQVGPLESATNVLRFDNIPASYRHLRIEGQFAGTCGASLMFNDDKNNNYNVDRTELGSTLDLRPPAWAFSQASWNGRAEFLPGLLKGRYASVIVEIPNYSGTVLNKSWSGDCQIMLEQQARPSGSPRGSMRWYRHTGFWQSTAAISSITVTAEGTSPPPMFAVGTVVSLYGLP